MKNTITLDSQRLKSDIDKMCWKKAGFKDYHDLMRAVRELPAEERLEMITELLLKDLAKLYMRRRTEFIESLGGHPGVKKEEILEWAKTVYEDTDTTEWRFELPVDYYVDPSHLTVEWYNQEHRQEWIKEQRRKRV